MACVAHVPHKSPQRELGDCDVAHQLASKREQEPGFTVLSVWGEIGGAGCGQVTEWMAGWRFEPQSPGARPGLSYSST